MKENSKYKREDFGTYIVISNADDTKHIATFKDQDGKFRFVKITSDIKEVFIEERKTKTSQRNEYSRYIEHSYLTEYMLNKRLLIKDKFIEEEFIDKEKARYIIREIWNLPSPQNRRVYMNIVDGFSVKEIAKIEKCSVQAIYQSLGIGIERLKEILKKI